MTNIAVLIGRPTKDIELRTTQSGISVASFTLAVDRDSSKQKDEADFVPCVAWNRTAEILSQYAGKGRLICVEGRIQTRNYDNKEGQRVYVTEVVAENVKLLPSGQKAQNGSQNVSSPQQGVVGLAVSRRHLSHKITQIMAKHNHSAIHLALVPGMMESMFQATIYRFREGKNDY